jgi:hypothetical protein
MQVLISERNGVRSMWESVLKNKQLEIQVNSDDKSIRFFMVKEERQETPVQLELNQSEMFELMHTFLDINRSFNKETMYFDEVG